MTLACALGGGGACGERPASLDAGAAASEAIELPRAKAIAEGREPLPARPDALALAESIEARAVREGGGTRAVALHAVAARVLERVWRVEGRDRDATEALEMYRAASRDPDVPGACEAALAGARLAGDAAHDATVAYAELYRVQRRFAPFHDADPPAGSSAGADADRRDAGRTCRAEVEDDLSHLAAFRPPQRVLDAIEAGLAGEGIASPAPDRAGAGPLVPVKPPRIVRVESWPGADSARVVVVLDRAAGYRLGDERLDCRGEQTFVDLDGVDVGDVARVTPGTGILAAVRAEATTTGSRVSLEVQGHAYRRAFAMREPFRIVLDVARHPPGVANRSRRAVARVVLDAGHGGRDTGAVGPTGLKEKDVTVDVARRAASALGAEGLQVMLTRGDDRFVSLEERAAMANAFEADLFVSIHCNASESKSRRGVETYVLDTTRDEITARIAARENATSPGTSAEVTAILGDIRLADQAQRSSRLAELLERAAASALDARYGDAVNGGVHPAGFYVLVGADMPSVLFETSYISNGSEEERLATDEYRQLLADAIANAVKAYREGR